MKYLDLYTDKHLEANYTYCAGYLLTKTSIQRKSVKPNKIWNWTEYLAFCFEHIFFPTKEIDARFFGRHEDSRDAVRCFMEIK